MRQKHKTGELQGKIENAPVILADFASGLSADQVAERIDEGLTNKTPKKVTKTYWKIFVDNIFTFFNVVYFVILILLLCGQANYSAYLFAVPVFGNVVFGLFVDIKARRLVDKLRIVSDSKVTVMRGGEEVLVGVRDVVLSDIVILRAGDQIPADGVILNGFVSVDESLLTGESVPVDKKTGDEVLSGTYIQSGKAYMRVTKIGVANYVETLQSKAKVFKRPKSEIKRSFFTIFFIAGITAIVFGVAETLLWLIKNDFQITYEEYQNFIPNLSGSLVAMIPAGLYLLSSFTLTMGVLSLAKKRMNVQELYCIEMLARVDVLCFDKTGTLTDGSMAISSIIPLKNQKESEIASSIRAVIEATGDENATAKAILAGCAQNGNLKATSPLPFDSRRKYSAAYIEGKGTYVLGAPGFVDGDASKEGLQKIEELKKQGYRVLGIYWGKNPIENKNLPAKLALIGVLSLKDNIKPDAKANIEWFQNNDVEIKIISGDDHETVSMIASACGVNNAEDAISLQGVSNEEIPDLAKRYSVFGRVSPEQKALLVEALQAEGHKVAMTGDGVNDSLALKKADCSIAMASGAAAARNVSHIVSIDNDFSKLPDVVAQGRRVINNLQRTASLFLSKTFFAIGASLFFFVTGIITGEPYPFTTSNMLIWEFFSIGLAGFFLSLEPSNERLSGGFLRTIFVKSVPSGIMELLSVVTIFVIHWCNPDFIGYEATVGLSILAFSLLSFVTFFCASLPFDRYRSVVFGGVLAFAIVLLLADYFAELRIFGIPYHLLDWSLFGVLAVVSVFFAGAYVFVEFLFKRLEKKRDNGIMEER